MVMEQVKCYTWNLALYGEETSKMLRMECSLYGDGTCKMLHMEFSFIW
jgi:hypothetical protein